MNSYDALKTAAQQVLADLAADAGDQWENYPEIGESDWETVVQIVQSLAPAPAAFAVAYHVLELRAEDGS